MMHPWFDVIMTLAVIGCLWCVIYVLTFRVAALMAGAGFAIAVAVMDYSDATSDWQIVLATIFLVIGAVLAYRFGQGLVAIITGHMPTVVRTEWWLSREDDEP